MNPLSVAPLLLRQLVRREPTTDLSWDRPAFPRAGAEAHHGCACGGSILDTLLSLLAMFLPLPDLSFFLFKGSIFLSARRYAKKMK